MSVETAPEVVGTYSTFAAEVDAVSPAVDPVFDADAFETAGYFRDVGMEVQASGVDAPEAVTSFIDSILDVFASPVSDNGIHENAVEPSVVQPQNPQNTASGPQHIDTVRPSDSSASVQAPDRTDAYMSGQDDAQTRTDIGQDQLNRDAAAQDRAVQQVQASQNTQNTSPNSITSSSPPTMAGLAVGAGGGALLTAAAYAVNPLAGFITNAVTTASTGVNATQWALNVGSIEPSRPARGNNNGHVQSDQEARAAAARHDAQIAAQVSAPSGYVSTAANNGTAIATGSVAAQMAPPDPHQLDNVLAAQKTTQQAQFPFAQAAERHEVYEDTLERKGAPEFDAEDREEAIENGDLQENTTTQGGNGDSQGSSGDSQGGGDTATTETETPLLNPNQVQQMQLMALRM